MVSPNRLQQAYVVLNSESSLLYCCSFIALAIVPSDQWLGTVAESWLVYDKTCRQSYDAPL